MARRWRQQRRAGRAAAGVGVLGLLTCVLLLSFPYFESIRNANERPRLLQAMALVDTGSWAIDGPASRGLDPGPDVARSEVDGRLYPNKPPGGTLPAAAGYLVARWWAELVDEPLTLRALTWWGRLLGGVLPTVLLCGFLLRRHRFERGVDETSTAVIVYGLGTPALAYAHLLYGHQLAALCLFVGAAWLCDAYDHGRADLAGLGGLVAGAAVAVDYAAVFAAVPLGVLLLLGCRQRRGLRVLVLALLGASIPVTALAAYHQVVFGSPWVTGYHEVIRPQFAAKHGEGLLGLGLPSWDRFFVHWLSTDGGLLWWAPLVVVGVIGLGRLTWIAHAHRTEARVWLGTLVVFAVVSAGLSFEGGWRVGPRYLVVVLPAMVLGWTWALGQLRRRPRLAVGFVALAVYQLVIHGLAAALWPHFDLANIHQPVAEVLLPLAAAGVEPHGPLSWLGWVEQGGAPWTAGATVGLALGGYLLAQGRVVGLRRWRWSVLLGGSVVGLGLVVATQWVPAHPRGPANLAYIRRVWEPGHGHESRRLPPLEGPQPVRGSPAVIPEPPRRTMRNPE